MNATTAFNPARTPGIAARDGTVFCYEDVQYAIEQLYDLRPKVIRIAFLGTLAHRPDPDHPTPQTERQTDLDRLSSEVNDFALVVRVLETGQPLDGIHPDLAKWMHTLAQSNGDALSVIRRVNALCQRVQKAAQSGSTDQSDALREHRKLAQSQFHPAITDLCLFMWRAYDKNQSSRLDRAHAAAAALSERLTRLERIGTHVRLVSLNASVEASRIGESGRGLSVITQEFKGLAEEVKTLAQEARVDVERMNVLD